jgi:PGDYG protein
MPNTSLFITHDMDLSKNVHASTYFKHELVNVSFATTVGAIKSREGLNHYAAGDAIITGSTGDCWSVSRDRFDAKYQAVSDTAHGHNGQYQNQPLAVLAIQQTQAFAVERSAGGDVIHGQAGDWLMQYAPGDHGIVENAKFQHVYRAIDAGGL